ncbi:hypothetical protein Tco_1030466 [Tanacetum coccineum]|uniref:Uncharacterized protein n=1 Tax=Tanacetum coccineum TaxID=301880 RepID=A0ABQ5G6B1_9ASTR
MYNLGVIKNAGVGELEVEYFDIFQTRSELAYHTYLMCGPIPSIFLRNPIITEGYSSNLKVLCNMGNVHVEKAYIDLNSPLNVMTRMLYNWIMRRKLDPRENTNEGVNNFTEGIKDLEREHTKLVYLRKKEDKIRGVEYVMSKILGFYKECLELGPEYVTGIFDKGEVTKFFKENEKKIFSEAGDGVRIYPDGIVIFDEKKLGSS